MYQHRLTFKTKGLPKGRTQVVLHEMGKEPAPPYDLCTIEKWGNKAWWVPLPSGDLGPFKTRYEAGIEYLDKVFWGPEYESWCEEAKAIDTTNPRRDRHFSEEHAEQLYDLLAECAGATDFNRRSFVHWLVDRRADTAEFRFQGWLGFGGKFWVRGNSIDVTAYTEDMTPEVKMFLARTNRRLHEFYLTHFTGTDQEPLRKHRPLVVPATVTED